MKRSDLSRSRPGRARPALKNGQSSPWLRLCALGASGATALAVVSGAASWGTAHELLSALALPPLVAVVVAAWLGHRWLLAPALVTLALFGVAALITTPGLHLAAAAAAFASSVVLTALVHRDRGEARGSHAFLRRPGSARPAAGSLRDYVTLTKPRIMSLLLLTGVCGMFVGAGGVPPLGDLAALVVGLALACGGASALNHVLDRDIDSLMGERTKARPVTSRPRARLVRARVRPRTLGALVRRARRVRERPDRNARARRQPLLRARLHPLAEADDPAEHRDRRRGRGGAARRRVGSRDRERDGAGAAPLPDRLLLDAAALLGARAADQAQLRRGRDPDAPGRARRPRDRRSRSSSTRSCWSP